MSGDSDRCISECSRAGGPVSCRTGRYIIERSLPDLVWLAVGTQFKIRRVPTSVHCQGLPLKVLLRGDDELFSQETQRVLGITVLGLFFRVDLGDWRTHLVCWQSILVLLSTAEKINAPLLTCGGRSTNGVMPKLLTKSPIYNAAFMPLCQINMQF